ncbi:phospholipase D family protein (plasmid) [Arcobacter cryaerophilus gv. pseudocryaerophilus]|uniref:Phospholipase D family protein n=3 Tax=Arcobacteraceae TaxID=2808963 RepID=A0AA96DVJ6_9BACT|nr:phospholipase D family protein [Arcobacter sp. AZ-2023]WNL37309.1 phospholipase D family protein [Arcobacter sp. AZ-2023]WPD13024.1 phospholipase D family protein [Arcobacter sp. DSM 115960]
MTSLFSTSNQAKYLNIIFNDQIYNGNIEELFDTKEFNSLSVCTFVSSVKYFFNKVNQFEKIELLLGIEDGENAQKFLYDPNYTSKFFSNLDKKTLTKILDNNVSIRFTSNGTTIHSKIYILKNLETKNTRIMFGSANFSTKAFSGDRQFEELVVYDSTYNSKIVDIFIQRYEEIKKFTNDFVPDIIRKKVQKEDKLIILNAEDSLDILQNRLKDVQIGVILPEELSKNIETTKKVIINQEENLKKELKSLEQTKTVIEIVTKATKGINSFITPAQFLKNKEQLITKVLKTQTIIKEFKDSRINLIYSPLENHFYIKGEESNDNTIEKFTKECDTTVLKEKLELLDKFINVYTKYTMNKEEATKKRIFEAILYAFTSPCIWKIRENIMFQQGRDEAKSAIPLFMLIAGQSQSGKTHLLKFISQIMGNLGNYYHFSKNSKLSSMSEINPQAIYNFFEEENLMPIFIDEITKDYFSSNSSSTSGYMGEGFMKKLTNSKEGKYPCMLASSNTDFSANSQVMRRMYYIQLNNPFDTSKKSEMDDFFTTLLHNFGLDLYKDFLYRLDQKINNGYEIDTNDILKPSREVFKDYFKTLDIPTPSYFSEERIDDYYIRGQKMWRDLYDMKYTGFREDKKNNTILLDDEIVFGTKLNSSSIKKELLQYLPIGVLVEDKGIVKLNYKNFFDFIKQNSKNLGFFKKIFY